MSKVVQWDDIPTSKQRKIFEMVQELDDLVLFSCGYSRTERSKRIKELKQAIDKIQAPYTKEA